MAESEGEGTASTRKVRKTEAKGPANARSTAVATGAAGKSRDWRDETLDRIRQLILEADPEAVEEVKWRKPSNGMTGVPVWSHGGIICTGEKYKNVVKLTFPKGASLEDPAGLFNSSLEGNARRAIDIKEGEAVDAKAFKALIRAAVTENLGKSAPKPMSPAKPAAKPQLATKAAPSKGKASKPVKLLSGGNPQIAKAYGDAPVQDYIAAMPGWKRDLGQRLDELITQIVPNVHKAVKWNSPFYGIEGQGWFLSFHCFTKYVKVAFFRGMSLRPIPPGESKSNDTRYLDIRENDPFDAAQFTAWVTQASQLPGERM